MLFRKLEKKRFFVRATLAAPILKDPNLSDTQVFPLEPIPGALGQSLKSPLAFVSTARSLTRAPSAPPLARARYFPTARDMSLAYSPLPLASPPLPFLRLPLAVPEAPSYVKLILVLGSLILILGKGRMETTVDNLSMAYDDFMAPSHDHSSSWAPTHVQLVWSWAPTVLGRRSNEELPAPSPRPSLPSR
jgi:hypothetical protein